MPRRTTSQPDAVSDMIRNEDWAAVAAQLIELHPADVADIINRVPQDARERLFALLPEDAKPEVLAELESVTGTDVVDSLSNAELSDIVEDMAPDDAADLLADLPEDRSEQVLALMEREESEEVRRLLEYAEDTAGGIMTPDVVAMHANQTVAEALEAIAYLDTREQFYYAYIVDAGGNLSGFVDIWELLRERNRNRPLGELVHEEMASATVDTDQEEVAMLMSKYDLSSIPVVDAVGRLVGRVTADDVIDVMEEEASEDIFRLAGSDQAELESVSAFHSSMLRLPWLLVTLLGGFITSMILKHFHARVTEIVALSYFVPIVLAMGGNTGIQSATLVVRRIALGHLENMRVRHLLLREVMTGILMGVVCGTIIGIWARFMVTGTPAMDALHLAMTVGFALFAAMGFATVFGALVPLALDRLNIDPAVASGPFVTIANDVLALLIYFGVTILMISRLA